MEAIFKLVLLIGGFAFALYVSRLQRKKLLNETPKVPGTAHSLEEVKRARYLGIGVSSLFYLFAVNEWIDPSLPPFTGRGAWLIGGLYYGLGPRAFAFSLAIFATLILLVVLFNKQTKKR